MTKGRPITPPEQERIRECFRLDPYSPSGLAWKVPHPTKHIKQGDPAGSLYTQKSGHQAWRVILDGRQYGAHNLIWLLVFGEDPATRYPLTVDHIDRDGSNNTHSNLRLATKTQQIQNQRVYGVSRYKGIHLNKATQKWLARWLHPVTRKRIYLGYFTDERKAFNKCVQARFIDFAERKRIGK